LTELPWFCGAGAFCGTTEAVQYRKLLQASAGTSEPSLECDMDDDGVCAVDWGAGMVIKRGAVLGVKPKHVITAGCSHADMKRN
jgi:hypothetical protein